MDSEQIIKESLNKYKNLVNSLNEDFEVPELLLPKSISYTLLNDPKHIAFHAARHKFVIKMLSGKERVLEIGCAGGFSTMITAPYFKEVVAIDFYEPFIQDAIRCFSRYLENTSFLCHDILKGPVYLKNDEKFDAAFSLDVLEHIDPNVENLFFQNILLSLKKNCVFIVGMPSLESQVYASKSSKLGHVNCKTGEDLKGLCERYFDYVFLFSMNDEVIHTGFTKMAHYLIAICANKKNN